MPKLRVTKKSYTRKGYTRKDGTSVRKTEVPKTTFYIKDRGAKGRGRKVIPPLKRGTLGIKFSDSDRTIKSTLKKKASALGEKRVAGKLRAISVLNKRTNPRVSKKAGKLASWVSGSFKGKRYTGYPKGYGRSK